MMGSKGKVRKPTKLDEVDSFDGNRPQDGLTFTDSPSQESAGDGDAMRQLLMLLLGEGV